MAFDVGGRSRGRRGELRRPVDHPTSLPRELPWRTTALVAAGVAALELVLVVVLGAALLAKPLLGGDEGSSSATAKEAAPATHAGKAPPAVAKLARSDTSVIVLNGNGSPGAAGEKADLVQTRGYMVTGTANAPRTDFTRSIVMYRPGYQGEAERLARDFKIDRVAPLDGLRPADLQGAHVALIVGAS